MNIAAEFDEQRVDGEEGDGAPRGGARRSRRGRKCARDKGVRKVSAAVGIYDAGRGRERGTCRRLVAATPSVRYDTTKVTCYLSRP